ncbi:hypothetical protein [Psychrobacter sp. UBA3962]|uniref:hypothetical protein n=1 Tax=Psychrobacter sp. UBA3962 TaxID=1947352 RepID=UPI0025F099B8|nr:hypothetical protein [Psychrobacter sp. UBA3962]
MIKFFVLLISMGVSSASFGYSEIDDELLSRNLVDDNYVYTNISGLANYFRESANEIAMSLPLQLNSYIQLEGVALTPRFAQYIYRYAPSVTNEDLSNAKRDLLSNENLNIMCSESHYPYKFKTANDFETSFFYKTSTNEKVAEVVLTNKTCSDAKKIQIIFDKYFY